MALIIYYFSFLQDSQTGDDLEATLPASIRSIPSPIQSEDRDDSSYCSEEDPTAALLTAKVELEKDKTALQEKLNEASRELVLANNLRIKHKNDLEKAQADLKKFKDQVLKLTARNELLQDKLFEAEGMY